MDLANQHNLKTIAFPSISTGVYGYPFDEAAEVRSPASKQSSGAPRSSHALCPPYLLIASRP
jgi:O-acetyl-ADP-ribose deacetylase (regulator of RNase III)